MSRNDPLRRHRFRVQIEGIDQAGFAAVSGLEVELTPIHYREGSEPNRIRKLPGLLKNATVTLKWGVTDSMELYNWFKEVSEGVAARRAVHIVLGDEAGQDRARWELSEAWPCRYVGPALDAECDEVAIEAIELCHEGLCRTA